MATPAAPTPSTADADVSHLLGDDAQGVQQSCEDDSRRAVLVVVEHGDVEGLAKARLHLETTRRRDVLEVDPAVDRGDALDDPHDLVDILCREANGPGIDTREAFEEEGFSLHDRKRRRRPDVPEAQHGRPVGHHSDCVALDREVSRDARVVGDRHRDAGDPGRISHRKVIPCLERHLGLDRDRPTEVEEERPVAHGQDVCPFDSLDCVAELGGVLVVDGVAGQVDDHAVLVRLDDVECGDRAAGVADRSGDRSDARGMLELYAHRH